MNRYEDDRYGRRSREDLERDYDRMQDERRRESADWQARDREARRREGYGSRPWEGESERDRYDRERAAWEGQAQTWEDPRSTQARQSREWQSGSGTWADDTRENAWRAREYRNPDWRNDDIRDAAWRASRPADDRRRDVARENREWERAHERDAYGRTGYGPSGTIGFGATDPLAHHDLNEPTDTWRSRPQTTGFAGRGPRGYRRSDERIREDVSDRLTDHPAIDASDIDVEVIAAEVMLRGMVDSRAQRRLAEDIADSVSGVRDVSNQIKVRRETPAGASGWSDSRTVRSMTDPVTTPAVSPSPIAAAAGATSVRTQLRPSLPVFSLDGEEIGRVKEIRTDDFLVDRPMKRDIYVPFDQVRETRTDRVTLLQPKDRIDDMRWENPPILMGAPDRSAERRAERDR